MTNREREGIQLRPHWEAAGAERNGNVGQVSPQKKELKTPGGAQGSPSPAGISTWLCAIPRLLLIPGIPATLSWDPGMSWDKWHGQVGGILERKSSSCGLRAQRAWAAAGEGRRAFPRGLFGNSTGQLQGSPGFPFRIQILGV